MKKLSLKKSLSFIIAVMNGFCYTNNGECTKEMSERQLS